jgi:chromosome segregation ATPase
MNTVVSTRMNTAFVYQEEDNVESPAPNPEVSRDPVIPTPSPPIKVMSRSEAIRARLREKEKRLSSLVRGSNEDGTGSFLCQMASVKDSLKKVEDEKSELENELERLRNSTGEDEFLKEKMAGIQEGFDKQVAKIQELQDEVNSKSSSIQHLRDELVGKLQKIVELEFDLETHDVHYTSYAAEQFKLGEDALAEIKNRERNVMQLGEDSTTSVGSMESKKTVSPRRAQKLISKLLADLDDLEARFKNEKLESSTKMQQLLLDNEDLRTKIQILEARTQESKEVDDSSETSSDFYADIDLVVSLRKRAETLEAKRVLYRKEMDRLQSELSESRKEANFAVQKANLELDRVSIENQTMKTRIETLESDLPRSDSGVRVYATVEKRIREAYTEMAKLESAVEIKDRQLGTLKKEVTSLRMKEISHGNVNGKAFTDFDSELLRSAHVSHGVAGDGDHDSAADSSYIAELQAQLQEAQQQLVKKDQELVIERAKAASTAAGLLARITELSNRRLPAEEKPPRQDKTTPETQEKDVSKPAKRGRGRAFRFYR